MDIIALARELGKAIQQEESYIKLHEVQDKADADTELQSLIGEFNLKRMSINNEASKKERDQDKLSQLNTEMREVYSKIMSNENMIAYNSAKEEFDAVANRVLAIVQQSAEGADPDTADYSQSSCSGSCETCGGCH
ncbi:MAG: YlbF family regulator [Ruminococcus bromii]|nr:YlbF family regulator [Ruminococcus bromii]MCI7211890.1 YlbF family regulator [Ruminococcus bromii]MDD6433904.1 YlbF family regulator [Ruminococcus bromii]MDY4085662.1 YlbF family regulator [Ruminococcus bromii]MDY4710843.1 YlbF family regulator [Ruminococcus bromii]